MTDPYLEALIAKINAAVIVPDIEVTHYADFMKDYISRSPLIMTNRTRFLHAASLRSLNADWSRCILIRSGILYQIVEPRGK